MSTEKLDLIIIGGGPAGMSGALIAGRTLMQTAIINAEKPRNRVTTASHGFLSRDGIHPMELLEISKQQLEQYKTVNYIKGTVTDVVQSDGGYLVKLEDGQRLIGENIIFASGFKEDISKTNLPGVEKVYGRSVFPCPFCDGWEHKGEKLAVFGEVEFTAEFAKIISNWSNDIIIFTNGNKIISAESKKVLAQGGIGVIEEKISRLISDENGKLLAIQLKNGARIEREAGFIMDTYEKPANDFPIRLGVGMAKNAWGMDVLEADEFGKTNVEGIYVVGDAKSGFGGILASARDGAACVEMLLHERVSGLWAELKQRSEMQEVA